LLGEYLRQKIVNYRFSDVVGEVVVVLGLLFILGGIYLWSVTGEEDLREGAFIIALGLMLALAGVGISAQREQKNSGAYEVYTD
jgi:predicted transporter